MTRGLYEPTGFAKRLQDFLYDYSPASMGSSPNTLSSYCSTFRQYLFFREKHDKITADNLELNDFTADSVEDFLNWVEQDRGCKAVTRNQRLASIHAFCYYLIRKEPLYIRQSLGTGPSGKEATSQPIDTQGLRGRKSGCGSRI